MLTACGEETVVRRRDEAAGWLARRLEDWGHGQAQYALTALTGGAEKLDASQRLLALRFMLGLADTPGDDDEEGSPSCLLGYGAPATEGGGASGGEGDSSGASAT